MERYLKKLKVKNSLMREMMAEFLGVLVLTVRLILFC